MGSCLRPEADLILNLPFGASSCQLSPPWALTGIGLYSTGLTEGKMGRGKRGSGSILNCC
jgi:hypothetical protein